MLNIRRMFSRKSPKNVSKSLRCTEAMWEAITKLAKHEGESPNAFVVLILDEFLQLAVEQGKVAPPPDYEVKPAS